jgi:hypothetical protein
MVIDIKQQIKEVLLEKNITMTDLVNFINRNKPDKEKTSLQSLNNKLTRGTIKYSEILEIAQVLDYDIIWKNNSNIKHSSMFPHKIDINRIFAGSGRVVTTPSIIVQKKTKYGTITGSKSKNIKKNNTKASDSDKHQINQLTTNNNIFELSSYQDRLDLERDFETNIDNLLDIIINNYDPKIQEYYKEFIDTFSGAKNFPLSYKLTTLYRVIYRLLSVQSDSSLRDFITNLRNIYMDGDLIKLTDEELKELYDKSLYYLNIFDNKNND